jgi:hypothetical protein
MFSTLQTGLKRLGTDASGQEMLEAAIVFPVFFLIVLGIFWFGRAYNIYATVTHAAAEGARIASSPTCATCANSYPSDLTVVSTVSSILRASRLDPNQIAPYIPTPLPVFCPGLAPPSGACTAIVNNVTICRGVELNNATSTPQVCGTMVSFQYHYQFVLPFTSLLINLPASAQARVED